MTDVIAHRLEAMRHQANMLIAQGAALPGSIRRIEPLYPLALPAPDIIRCELLADDDRVSVFHVSPHHLCPLVLAAAHVAFISSRIPEITEVITGDEDDCLPYPVTEADDAEEDGPKPGERLQ